MELICEFNESLCYDKWQKPMKNVCVPFWASEDFFLKFKPVCDHFHAWHIRTYAVKGPLGWKTNLAHYQQNRLRPSSALVGKNAEQKLCTDITEQISCMQRIRKYKPGLLLGPSLVLPEPPCNCQSNSLRLWIRSIYIRQQKKHVQFNNMQFKSCLLFWSCFWIDQIRAFIMNTLLQEGF